MPTRYLDPKVDLAFKRVFGEHEHLLRSFLNALLPLPDDGQIESLEYLTPKQVPDLPGLYKNSIMDVQCKDLRGRTFIVEMQMLWSSSFEQRILFSANEAHVRQRHMTHNYASSQPVYALVLTNEVFDETTHEYYHHYPIVRQPELCSVLEGLQFVFIELPKFTPQCHTGQQMQIHWLRFLTEVGDNPRKSPNSDPFWREDPDIALALRCVEEAAFSDDDMEVYHIHIDKARIELTVLEDARAEGKAKGKAEGLAKAKAEAIAKMVRTMHARGLDAVQIRKFTGLSEQQVLDILGADGARNEWGSDPHSFQPTKAVPHPP